MRNLRVKAGYTVVESRVVGVFPFERKLLKLRSNADPSLFVVAYVLPDGQLQDSEGKVGIAKALKHNKRTQAATKFKGGF